MLVVSQECFTSTRKETYTYKERLLALFVIIELGDNMCGRFIVSFTAEELLEFLNSSYQIEELNLEYSPRFNVSPGQKVLSVIKSKDRYKVGYLDWGFIPSFSTDKKLAFKMINARSETLTEKVSFKESLRRRRCLILANGFYEWKRVGNQKIPYLIKLNNDKLFAFAGLWSMNDKVENNKVYTTTIITTKANEIMSDIHNRMPVILDVEESLKWLDYDSSIDELLLLLEQYDTNKMIKYQVSDYVNNSRNEGEECIKEV